MNGSIPGPVAKSMGRDKQPFTYLPGGIDFSELKSPKMKKRIDKHLEGSGQSADQKVTPFGSQQNSPPNQSSNNDYPPVRGQSLPRTIGSSTLPAKKQDFKKQGSITNLLSMAVPDPPPEKPKPQANPEPVFYNPYAPKKPIDDSVINYTDMNGNHGSKNGISSPPAMPLQNNNNSNAKIQPMASNYSSPPVIPVVPMQQKAPLSFGQNSQQTSLSVSSSQDNQLSSQQQQQQSLDNNIRPLPPPALPPTSTPTQPPPPTTSTPPPPPPPPPPQWDEDTQTFNAPKAKASKVMGVHAQLQTDKLQKLEIQKQEELEKKRLEELERQRQEELERKRQEEIERQRLEELERIRQAEIEKKRLIEMERIQQMEQKRLEELKRQEEERQQQEHLRRQREQQAAEMERKQQQEAEMKQRQEKQRQQLELENKQKQSELQMQLKSGHQHHIDSEDENYCDPSYFQFNNLDELELLRQQQEELKKLEELQRLKLEELNRLKEEERKRGEQIKRLQSKNALEHRKRQELEQYMKEELQRQQALTSTTQGGMHQLDSRTDQHEQQSQGQQRKQYVDDVPDFARNNTELFDAQVMQDFDKPSKDLCSTFNRNNSNESQYTLPPYLYPKEQMEPMELYEELPSEMEMGVSAYEIDRARFRDRVKPNGVSKARGHAATPPLPPPSPTGGKRGRRTLSSPKPNPADQYKVADQLKLEQEQQLLRELQKEEEMKYLEQMGKQKQLIEARKQQLLMEEQRKQEEEYQKLEQKKRDEQQLLRIKREEEQKKLLEDQRRKEEQIKIQQQQQHEEEQRRLLMEEQLKKEEQRRLQQQREEEQRRLLLEAEQRQKEEQMQIQKRQEEEQQRRLLEEQRRQEEQMRIQQQKNKQKEEEQRRLLEEHLMQEEQIRIQLQREEERRQMEEKRTMQIQEDQRRQLEEVRSREEKQQQELDWRRSQAEAVAKHQEEMNQRLTGGVVFRPPQTFDLMDRPFFSPPPMMPPSSNFFHASEFFPDPLVDGHKKLEPIFSKPQNNGPAERSSNDDQNGENVSRIIPIKVEKIAGAFNQSKTTTTSGTDSPNLNTLQELQQHQSLNKAEESIRGFSKPKVNNGKAPTRGSGFVDEMKAKPSFAQRERDSSAHAVESMPMKPTENNFQIPKLKPITRQASLPEPSIVSSQPRRSSETDFLNKTRKNVVSELESVGDTKNHKPSNMFGPKKTPSQSPYMRLLNRALSKSETNGDHDTTEEQKAVSKEYMGEEGRYLPPKHNNKTNLQYPDHSSNKNSPCPDTEV